MFYPASRQVMLFTPTTTVFSNTSCRLGEISLSLAVTPSPSRSQVGVAETSCREYALMAVISRVTLHKSLASVDLSSLRLAAGGDLIAYTPFMSRPEIDKFARSVSFGMLFRNKIFLLAYTSKPHDILERRCICICICKMYFQVFRLCIALYLVSALVIDVRCQDIRI